MKPSLECDPIGPLRPAMSLIHHQIPEQLTKLPHVSTPNLEGQETVFVKPLTIDQPVMRDSLSKSHSGPNDHATRRKQESWDTARLSKPIQGKSIGRGRGNEHSGR
ncbi:hypothetical protein T265_03565 [Opisthorchis viverrini]|uniref:Uncharacterized protein n=1 Tax=Opisthorchis viverrini TaxID=6198 RepID=A0A074ZR29_OPIVI|nr:hypothetical protein T265_03565 [Opisthorchis viverrini]KER29868.1 hypothetical protein T265_03565 [Opisthorchis viverrini]